MISNLPNRIKTSFSSFSDHILSSINENFLLLVRYESGRTITKDRCSSLRINYWALTLRSILYDFWGCSGQGERERALDTWLLTLWVRRIWSCHLLSLGQDSNAVSTQLQFLFYGTSKGAVRENQIKGSKMESHTVHLIFLWWRKCSVQQASHKSHRARACEMWLVVAEELKL